MERKILLLAGSAGGFSVILNILKSLEHPIRIPVIVIVHRNPKYASTIEETLSKALVQKIKTADDKEAIENGTIYFAPAGYHLLVEPDYSFSLDISEPVQYSRPSIDVTFESVAEVYRENCIAILFSGANQDGAQGLLMIKRYGGKTVVQDPTTAEVPVMPEAAIQLGAQERILTIQEIKDYIKQLT
ncbi:MULTISPECIES: chemotaxis protein CheB [unclassified Sphingobacterium]|uniref:chemotaxis protein CheB n=1 Tax=unclassified Sphingobacterium TaxID=2609468 RepID=UPI001AE81F2F|nr:MULTISPECIES: chemotaxis protein CheB [unclassified Sphingobacterium]MDR6737695.1 two-component system chemotaxis response regulator CheB [Sphingobacterium sp. 2149]